MTKDLDAWKWLDENQLGYDIWEKKYRRNDEDFEQWLERVSAGNEDVKKLIREKKFLFGGRVLANRGIPNSGNYFNCFSRGYVEDDFNDIMDAAKDIALTYKSQGGQGLSLSKLRPKGTPITGGYESDGIVPFMKIYNEITAGVSQGNSRKGALMISLDAKHKEAESFIKIKSTENSIEKANLSIEVDDEFMKAVAKYYDTGEEIVLHEKRNYSGHIVEYDVIPIKIFKAMVDNCYDWGDPACLYIDRFRNYNLMELDPDYQIITCNPCGEQPLPKHGACCLSSLNLSAFVENPYTKKAHFNFDDFEVAIKIGVEALNEIIDENYSKQPLKEQQEMSYNYRNIGLGVFGYATALMKLGFSYGDKDCLRFTNALFAFMFKTAVMRSSELAKKYGSFPKYKESVFDSEIIKTWFLPHEIKELKKNGLRNCSLLSIAPSGSISTMLGESSGCEPEFALKYTRKTIGMSDGKDKYYEVYCKAAKEYMQLNNTDKLPKYFVCAEDIPWEKRIYTQAVMQRYVDTAISSTLNLPESATKEDVAQAYLLAWKLGCKGLTIFRNGCLKTGVLTQNSSDTFSEKPEQISSSNELPRGMIETVPKGLTYRKYKINSGCGKLYLFVGIDEFEGKIYDIFTNTDGVGGCVVNTQCNSRLLSAGIRGGVPIEYLIEQCQKSGVCPSYQYAKGAGKDVSKGKSCASAIANILSDIVNEYKDWNEMDMLDEQNLSHCKEIEKMIDENCCPDCGSPINHAGGCISCLNCGWSKCD